MARNKNDHMMIISKRGTYYPGRESFNMSRFGLYFAQALLVIGGWLVLFNYLGVFSEDAYLWSYSLVELWIVLVGVTINFGCVPYLYFSSLLKYKKNDSFWDVETSWILCLFFAGMLLQYGIKNLYMVNFLVIIILTTFVVHAKYMVASRRISNLNVDSPQKYLYYETMKYLGIYYVLIIVLFALFNPFDYLQAWF